MRLRHLLARRAPAWAFAWTTAGAVLTGVLLMPRVPVVLWNATASAPLGLYRLSPLPIPRVGDWVALRPPRALAAWIVGGGYVPPHVPLLKRVAAVAGQTVCREAAEVRIDGALAARARPADRKGAPLPAWRGCHVLEGGEVFLLNAAPDSLDGRYFGASRVADLIGRAQPLLTFGGPS